MELTTHEDRRARVWPGAVALALVLLGAWLRLHRLDAMEFKADEQEALNLGLRLLADQPWSSNASFPTHGMLSSNGVPNAPLFSWIVAAAWAATGSPIGVTAVIALTNALCLYPLWQWARRRTSETTALLMLAIVAVSPFAVQFSRKIWTQDLLLPGVIALLWGVEWLRSERFWRGVALLIVAVLLVGQLHQSGAIGMALLPVAIAVQHLFDRRRGVVWQWQRPSRVEAASIAVALAVNVFFWTPYLDYLAHLPDGLLGARPRLNVIAPALLVRVEAQVVPVDLLASFLPDRSDFFGDPVRAITYWVASCVGAPLLALGLWRWLRSPFMIPVFGIWWWCVIVTFTLARIPSYPFYVLTLAPLTAVLAAGAFDAPRRGQRLSQLLTAARIVYVGALFGLTLSTQTWLAARGGAAGDYGVAYGRRVVQAHAIVDDGGRAADDAFTGRARAGSDAILTCNSPPAAVVWLARWLGGTPKASSNVRLCDGWLPEGNRLVYRWALRE